MIKVDGEKGEIEMHGNHVTFLAEISAIISKLADNAPEFGMSRREFIGNLIIEPIYDALIEESQK